MPSKKVLFLRYFVVFFLLSFLNVSCFPLARDRKNLHWGGWLAYWDFDSAAKSFVKHAAWYEEISLFLYAFKEDGTLYEHSVPGDLLKQIRYLAKKKRISLIPTIVNDVMVDGQKARLKDGNFMHQILGNELRRKQHIQEIVELLRVQEFDGIDIDYENLNIQDREIFIQFLKELKEALQKFDKRLVVTLEPKREEVSYRGPGAANWHEIGQIADQIRLMCYNLHYVNSDPGPIAPKDWVSEVVQYALENIPKEKIVVGLPFFGIDWIEKGRAKSLTTAQILSKLELQNIKSQKHPAFSSLYFQYADSDGILRKVWYEDSQTIQEKMAMIQTLGLNRFIFWRMGGEDAGIYEGYKEE